MLALQFAATACTIVSGAIAERTRFEAYILYSLFMSAWVYPVVVHSVWSSSGWASMFRSIVLPESMPGVTSYCHSLLLPVAVTRMLLALAVCVL